MAYVILFSTTTDQIESVPYRQPIKQTVIALQAKHATENGWLCV